MPPAPLEPANLTYLLDRVDIRARTIEKVEEIPGSGKLVALRVNFGDHPPIVAGFGAWQK